MSCQSCKLIKRELNACNRQKTDLVKGIANVHKSIRAYEKALASMEKLVDERLAPLIKIIKEDLSKELCE